MDQVRESLVEAGIERITVSHVSGHGRQTGGEEIYRGQKVIPNLSNSVRLEIAVNDEFVEPTIDAIAAGSSANVDGMIGSGKIFIMPLDDVVRLRTGERGKEAI